MTPTAEEQSDELLLVLAFSGGGTRAAALSYGVLEALDEVSIPATGIEGDPSGDGRTTMLNQVDIVSSVSGGSVTYKLPHRPQEAAVIPFSPTGQSFNTGF